MQWLRRCAIEGYRYLLQGGGQLLIGINLEKKCERLVIIFAHIVTTAYIGSSKCSKNKGREVEGRLRRAFAARVVESIRAVGGH